MNRQQAAKQLGITKTRLARLERDGVASPERDARRVPVYSQPEVDRIRDVIAALPSAPSRHQPAPTAQPPTPDSMSLPNRVPSIRSERTLELLDEAEQLEAATRVAQARRQLAAIDGTEEQLTLELTELRSRDMRRAAAERMEQERQAWRRERIEHVLKQTHHGLLSAGFGDDDLAGALWIACAVLASQSDQVLAGAMYPLWLSHKTIADTLRLPPPSAPMVSVTAVGPYGPVQTMRVIGPGD